MRLRFVLCIAGLAAAALVMPQIAPAQSLGAVAAKDKEKRKAKKPAKVFTEEDLANAKGRSANTNVGTGSAPAAPAAAGAGQAGAGTTPAEGAAAAGQKAELEKNWQERMKAAEADVARLSDAIATLSGQYSASASDPYNPQRQAIANQIEVAKARLADKQEAVADLKEEGSKNGYH
jgi:hypothetical protein